MVAVVVHRDIDEDDIWINRLEHVSHTVVDIEALQTGQSSDVRGRIRVFRRQWQNGARATPGAHLSALGEVEHCYTVSDGGLKFLKA